MRQWCLEIEKEWDKRKRQRWKFFLSHGNDVIDKKKLLCLRRIVLVICNYCLERVFVCGKCF